MPDSSPLSVSTQNGITIVEFTHNKVLDEAVMVSIGEGLGAIVAESPKPRLLLDFANVDHLTSAALALLISVDRQIREKNGELRLANIKPSLAEVFKLTRLDKHLRLMPSREAALASFQGMQNV